MNITTEITSIKGFDANLRCRGHQFEIGHTYTVAGKVEACKSGFHACPAYQHPLGVFEYYPPAGNRFAVVRQSGDTNASDNKLASATITIDMEISLGELTRRAVEWVMAQAEKADRKTHVTGERQAASATGDQGAASATGYRGAASATGDQGAASATGDQGAASATGYQGAASATGYRGAASATGYQGAASATGYQGAAMAAGYEGKVSGAMGNALFAVERNCYYEIVSVASGIVGRDGIEPGVWYMCRAGKLVAA